MHDADPGVADFRHQVHRQRGESRAHARVDGVGMARNRAQSAQYRVRAFDVMVGLNGPTITCVPTGIFMR